LSKFIYLISQNYSLGYDTYDSCVVCATSPDEARNILPNGETSWSKEEIENSDGALRGAWCKSPEQVNVERIGTADDTEEIGVILASFNAG
jgi:hypothetical protein